METPLHTQKLAILSRLIKESSLTLEEALLLLKEEEIPVNNIPFQSNMPSFDLSRPYVYYGNGTTNIPVNPVSTTLTN